MVQSIMKVRKIEISPKTIIFIACFVAIIAFLWQIRATLTVIFISFVLMQALDPLVKLLEKSKIPRVLAIVITYILVIGVLSFCIAGVIPVLIQQTTALIQSLPRLMQDYRIFGKNSFFVENNIDLLSQFSFLENIPASFTKIAISTFSNLLSTLMVFFISFYLLLEKKNFSKYGDDIFGQKGKKRFLKIMDNLESSLGSWVGAQLLLMLIIGLLSYFGYLTLGLKYAVPLAIVAGLLEAVPNIGPIVTTLLAGLVALTSSPITAVFTVIFGFLVQQLENNFIVPKIMNKTVGLNPLLTIILIAAGSKLAGVGGALLALPVFLTAQAIFKGFFSEI